MKKRMNDLLNGKFEEVQQTLTLSEPEITGKTMERENFIGKFSVLASGENSIHGFVYSTNPRIGLRPDHFSGMGETIRFEADVTGMNEGDLLKGEFVLNTSVGERRLPYQIQIEGAGCGKKETLGTDLLPEGFAAFAREEFGKAYVLFLSGAFRRQIASWGHRSETLYDALLAEGASYHCLEQFLVGIGAKEPVHISLEQEQLVLHGVNETRKEELVIRKSTWGFLQLKVSCDAEFLTLDRTELTSEEFVGSVCHLGFVIQKEKLHGGRQYANITISSGQEEVSCLVEVHCVGMQTTDGDYLRRKKETAELMQLYIAYRIGRLEKEAWCAKSRKILEHGCLEEESPIFRDLYECFVVMRMGDTVRAELLLGQIQQRKEELQDGRWMGAYLYLTSLQNADAEYQEYVKEKIQEFYLQQQESWILLWMMFRINGHLYRNDSEKLEELRRTYELGSRSPMLFLEAYEILKREPLMLRRMDTFDIHLLAFLKKEQISDPEITGQAALLAQRQKGFQPVLFRVLTAFYQQIPTRNLLGAICKMLMEGRRCEKKYAKWFALGVMQDIRITGLYEYFVETADELDAQKLPKAIRLYFVYHNTLDAARKAAIYAAVIKNRQNDEETYISYRKGMELFMEEQLAEGRANQDLAVLYENLLTEEVMTPALAAGLEKALFTWEVTCEAPTLRYLIVRHKALGQEQRTAISGGRAWVQILSPDYVLLAEDQNGRRYAAEPFCRKKKLLMQEELEQLCRRHLTHPYRFLLHDCITEESGWQIEEAKLEKYLLLLQMPELKESCRRELQVKLLEYFAQHSRMEEAGRFLEQIDISEMAADKMREISSILAGQDRYAELYQLICVYGMEKVEIPILVHMCSCLLSERTEEDKMLLAVCVWCFEHRLYDEKMLAFLMQYYEGSLERMKEIWYAGTAFHLESFELEEKILALLLFLQQGSEGTEAIFASYEKKKGKSGICRAYVTWMSYEFFIREQHVDWSVFAYIEQHMLGITGTPKICRLALLKRYVEHKEKSAGQQKWMRYFLERCLAEGMYFAFMMKLPKKIKEQYHLHDKFILEYRTLPGKTVVLHYRYQDQKEKSVLLKEAFEGIYTQAFTMFYKDTLEWYVTVEDGEKKEETEKRYYSHIEAASRHGASRYDLINQMTAAQEKGEEGKLQELAQRYEQLQYLVDTMFG